MSGLCAVVQHEETKIEQVLDLMLRRMTHYPWLRAVSHVDAASRVGLGAVGFETGRDAALCTARDGLITAVLAGEFFDTDAERRRLEEAGTEFHNGSDAELLLAGWRHRGPEFLARLNGEFTALIWDRTRREVHVVTDRFGLRQLYVAEPSGAFVVASEIKSVLAVPGVDVSWSEQGAAQFFSFGHFFGDDTLLKGVRALPPATVGTYRLADRRYEETKYWRLRPASASAEDASRGEAFEEQFARAVAKRARPGERLGLSLSGGLDARTILGVVSPGLDLKTVSLGIDGSLDHKSAAELATIARVPHHQLVLDASFLSAFEEHLRQMVLLTDGHYLDQGIVMPTMPVYRRLGIDYLMRGHGGELLHMNKAYAYSLERASLLVSDTELETWLFGKLSSYMLDGVPRDLFAFDLRAGATTSLRLALGRCQATGRPVDLVWQVFLNERIHRETTLSMHTFNAFATVRQPYLDNDVIDTLFSMPAEMKMGDDLQVGILARRRPEFLAVTNSNTGARLGAGLAETALARLRLKVGAKLGLKGYQPYERLGLWLRQDLRPLTERVLLSQEFLSRGLCRADVVRRVMNEHATGKANHTFLIMALFVYELGQQMLSQPETFAPKTVETGASA